MRSAESPYELKSETSPPAGFTVWVVSSVQVRVAAPSASAPWIARPLSRDTVTTGMVMGVAPSTVALIMPGTLL